MAEKEAICVKCGSTLEPGSLFCGECGTSVEAAVAPKPAEKPAAPKPAPATEPSKQPNLARTMLGFDAAALLRGAQAQPAPPKTPGHGTPDGAFTAPGTEQPAKEPAAPDPAPPVAKPPQAVATATGSPLQLTVPFSALSTPSAEAKPGPRAPAASSKAASPTSADRPGSGRRAEPAPAAAPARRPDAAPAAAAPRRTEPNATPQFPRAPSAFTAPAAAAPPVASAAAAPPLGPNAAAPPLGPTAATPPLGPKAAAPPVAPAVPAPAVVSAADDASSAQAVASDRPRRTMAKTMLGISPEAAAGLQRMAAQAEQAAPEPAPPIAAAPTPPPTAAPAPAGNPMARTMLGMANPPAGGPLVGGPQAPPPGAARGTLQGLATPPFMPQQPDRGAMARTMLGMAPLGPGESTPAPGTPIMGGAAPLGGSTMLGVPQPGAEEPSSPGTAAAAAAGSAAQTSPRGAARPDSEASRSTVPLRKENRALWPLVAATLVVVIATLVLLLRSPQAPHVDVSAKIVSSETGEALLFEVPSAPDGSKIRFGGQEKPLNAGRASFALAADSLRVGDNLVLAEVVRPNDEPAPVRITLAVFYRIWVDTAALRRERPALDVVVTALPGTHVTLDGDELKLDEAGRGMRSYAIDVVAEAKSGVIEHVVRYRVQPPSGEPVVDELRTRIPVAMMQVDRPGREVITDRESIEIAGAVPKDTQVSIDKTRVPIKDGRFLHRLPLPEPGDYKPRLVATAPGKAPLGVTLSIKRVKDLNQAASQFTPVADLTYGKLSPNPVIYRGQKISVEGRVYAVDARGAESVIQMFVRPCPSSRRCPLWVSDPHATEVAVDAWIRVLGVVQGEQQFRSEKNEIVTVPKVEAQFVLPAAP